MTNTLTRTATIATPRVGWRGWAALVVLMLPVLLVSVDNTVLSFALPQIALDLQPTAPSSSGSSTRTRWCWRACW